MASGLSQVSSGSVNSDGSARVSASIVPPSVEHRPHRRAAARREVIQDPFRVLGTPAWQRRPDDQQRLAAHLRDHPLDRVTDVSESAATSDPSGADSDAHPIARARSRSSRRAARSAPRASGSSAPGRAAPAITNTAGGHRLTPARSGTSCRRAPEARRRAALHGGGEHVGEHRRAGAHQLDQRRPPASARPARPVGVVGRRSPTSA